MSIRTEITTITPALAAEWLKRNKKNRPLNKKRVEKFANAMSNGEWVMNGDAIRFGLSGNLIDGQHRLESVILSGTTITSLVIYDLPDSVFTTIDNGGIRSLSDALATCGELNTTALAGSLSILWSYLEGTLVSRLSSWAAFTRGRQLRLLEEHPDLRNSVCETAGKEKLRKLLSPSAMGFLHYVLGKGSPDSRDYFIEKLQDASELKNTSAIYLLRERLQDNRSSKAKLPMHEIVALCFKAWNFTLTDTPVKYLRWASEGRSPQPFPMPRDLSGAIIFDAKQS